MLALTNPVEQIVTVGESVVFNTPVVNSKCGSECYRSTTGSIKMCKKGLYEVHFHANIGGIAGVNQLAIAVGGEIIPYTRMTVVNAAAGDRANVSVTIPLHNCCCDFDRITVINTSAASVAVANPLIYVKSV